MLLGTIVLLRELTTIRPFNSRKVLYVWEPIEAEMFTTAKSNEVDDLIPRALGGVYHG